MKTQGIRILDSENNVVSVKLFNILDLIKNGASFNWDILVSDIMPLPEEGEFFIDLENQVKENEKGLIVSWDQLKELSQKIHQEIDLTIIGCKDEKFLHRYENDKDMYEACDIVIEMIDSGYWEIFSKDKELIDKLSAKFKEVKPLKSDFEK